jgi:hypothetical protein
MKIKFWKCKKPFVSCPQIWQFADIPLQPEYGAKETVMMELRIFLSPEKYPVLFIDTSQHRKEEIQLMTIWLDIYSTK